MPKLAARYHSHVVDLLDEELDPCVGARPLDRDRLFGREFHILDLAADADDMIDVAV